MKKKCVLTVGPESSGSMLIAKICSHALGIRKWGEWDGIGWSDNGHHKVCHRSLPYGTPPEFPNVEEWVAENEKDYEIYFILTTRDVTISELSRSARFSKSFQQAQEETARAKEIVTDVMRSGHRYFIWSYETFMFLGEEYLNCLYQFLGVESDFMPPLVDGNRNRIHQRRLKSLSRIVTESERIFRFLTRR